VQRSKAVIGRPHVDEKSVDEKSVDEKSVDEKSKGIVITKVPMRKLMASLKNDIRKKMQATPSRRKPMKAS